MSLYIINATHLFNINLNLHYKTIMDKESIHCVDLYNNQILLNVYEYQLIQLIFLNYIMYLNIITFKAINK